MAPLTRKRKYIRDLTTDEYWGVFVTRWKEIGRINFLVKMFIYKLGRLFHLRQNRRLDDYARNLRNPQPWNHMVVDITSWDYPFKFL